MYREKLMEIFSKIGVLISDTDIDEEIKLDSIQHISVIVEIEDEFNIDVDDDYLVRGKLRTLGDYEKMIEESLIVKWKIY